MGLKVFENYYKKHSKLKILEKKLNQFDKAISMATFVTFTILLFGGGVCLPLKKWTNLKKVKNCRKTCHENVQFEGNMSSNTTAGVE